jgi:hypothetical protein
MGSVLGMSQLYSHRNTYDEQVQSSTTQDCSMMFLLLASIWGNGEWKSKADHSFPILCDFLLNKRQPSLDGVHSFSDSNPLNAWWRYMTMSLVRALTFAMV